MKPRHRRLALFAGLVLAAFWWHSRTPEPTVLAFRLGQTFEEVVRNSTYPALERSNKPAEDPGDHKFGAIWVSEPAVIVRFTDPKHGFTLPPTKFAVLTFSENQAVTLSTSPMLDPLPFDEAVAILESLQNQFKASGWEPWERNDSTWFDLTPEGKKRLYARMFEPGYMEATDLRVPKLYGMIFRIKCTEGCWTGEPPYLFLIDIGVSDDIYGWKPGEPMRWRQPEAAVTGSSVPG
ncbi:hypothetical protein [Massilia sp. GCM10023247]|uniref:hypothetical protein n=1 Tax=Massilia sp. GCM10023247 TaxID=3252643 RepID=UPI00361C0B41